MAHHYNFYNRSEYFKRITSFANTAKHGDRIALATMSFEPADPTVASMMKALCRAAQNGAEVLFLVDAYTFLRNETSGWHGPYWYTNSFHLLPWGPFKHRLAELEKLRDSGGNYIILNEPNHRFSVIPKGRSHMKFAVLNDELFLGGCNVRDASEVDSMVSWQDTKAANWLYDLAQTMKQKPTKRMAFKGHDMQLRVDDSSTILADAGKPGQSLIYENALQIIDDAQEKLFITCQYFPGGETAAHLDAARKRGVSVTIVYGHPKSHGKEAILQYMYNLSHRTHLPAQFFSGQRRAAQPRLHAKVLISEREAMLGSHNYITPGVTLGTAEIAIRSDSESFRRDLFAAIQTDLNRTN